MLVTVAMHANPRAVNASRELVMYNLVTVFPCEGFALLVASENLTGCHRLNVISLSKQQDHLADRDEELAEISEAGSLRFY
jgi:hypothetical protein